MLVIYLCKYFPWRSYLQESCFQDMTYNARTSISIVVTKSECPRINGEEKTKPTQHAIKQARSAGLMPDLVSTKYSIRLLANSSCRLLVVASGPSTRLLFRRLPKAAKSSLGRLSPSGIWRLSIKCHSFLRNRAYLTAYARL